MQSYLERLIATLCRILIPRFYTKSFFIDVFFSDMIYGYYKIKINVWRTRRTCVASCHWWREAQLIERAWSTRVGPTRLICRLFFWCCEIVRNTGTTFYYIKRTPTKKLGSIKRWTTGKNLTYILFILYKKYMSLLKWEYSRQSFLWCEPVSIIGFNSNFWARYVGQNAESFASILHDLS